MPARPRLAAAALSIAILASACAEDSTGETINLSDVGSTPALGDVQPERSEVSVLGLEFETFDGETASFDDHLGTPLVINFFAEWCPNCISEMPDFEAVSQELRGQVDFVGISVDRVPADGRRLVADTGVTYAVGWDPNEALLNHFQALAMPTTVFVDSDGGIARVWSGGLDADALTELINEEIL